jgi:hypothetical protein
MVISLGKILDPRCPVLTRDKEKCQKYTLFDLPEHSTRDHSQGEKNLESQRRGGHKRRQLGHGHGLQEIGMFGIGGRRRDPKEDTASNSM